MIATTKDNVSKADGFIACHAYTIIFVTNTV